MATRLGGMVGHAVEQTAPNCTVTYTNTKHNDRQGNKCRAYARMDTHLKHHTQCFACHDYDRPTHARESTPPPRQAR